MTSREALILKMAARLGLDPQAVDAIGNVEGRNALHGGNSVGDNGTSFGPFQLHAGGALPAQVWARGATYANNWANSPAGIQYALQHMVSSGAGGLTGQSAVQAISSHFERPADVAGEVSKAMGFYGGGGTGAGSAQYSPQGVPGGAQTLTGASGVNPYAAALLQQISQGGQQNAGLALLNMAMQRQQAGAAQQTYGPQPTTGPLLPPGQGAQFVGDIHGEKPHFLTALAAAGAAVGGTKIRVTSGYRSTQHNAAVGGVQGSNHTTGDAMDGDLFIPGKGWVPLGVALQGVAGKYGLRSGNVAGFFNGNPDPVHVDDGSNVH